MQHPLVSIILPVYNGEQYLDIAINSILKQTYTHFELIIVNDCSTDRSLEIMEGYQAKDSRIYIITNTINQKLPESLNIGHRQAKGTLLTWTSDDNILKPDCIQRLVETLVSVDVDLVYSDYDIIDSEGNYMKLRKVIPEDLILFLNVVGSCFLYKKEVFEKSTGYHKDIFLAEDYHFWMNASLDFKLHALEENLYQYRNHKNSLTRSIISDPKTRQRYTEAINHLFTHIGQRLSWDPISVKFMNFVHLGNEGCIHYYLKNRKIIQKDILTFSKVKQPENPSYILKHLYHYLQRQLRRSKTEKNFKTVMAILGAQPQIFTHSNFDTWSTFKLFVKMILGRP